MAPVAGQTLTEQSVTRWGILAVSVSINLLWQRYRVTLTREHFQMGMYGSTDMLLYLKDILLKIVPVRLILDLPEQQAAISLTII